MKQVFCLLLVLCAFSFAKTELRPGWGFSAYSGELTYDQKLDALKADLKIYGGFDLFADSGSLSIAKAKDVKIVLEADKNAPELQMTVRNGGEKWGNPLLLSSFDGTFREYTYKLDQVGVEGVTLQIGFQRIDHDAKTYAYEVKSIVFTDSSAKVVAAIVGSSDMFTSESSSTTTSSSTVSSSTTPSSSSSTVPPSSSSSTPSSSTVVPPISSSSSSSVPSSSSQVSSSSTSSSSSSSSSSSKGVITIPPPPAAPIECERFDETSSATGLFVSGSLAIIVAIAAAL